jgi:hypothetical protein
MISTHTRAMTLSCCCLGEQVHLWPAIACQQASADATEAELVTDRIVAVLMLSTRTIAPGEELFLDYNLRPRREAQPSNPLIAWRDELLGVSQDHRGSTEEEPHREYPEWYKHLD